MLIKVQYRGIVTQQNFNRITPMLTWTLRLRSIWIYRNIFTLLLIRHQLNLSKIPYWNWLQPNLLRNYFLDYIVQQKLYFLLTHIKRKSYTVRQSNFAKSCDYWALSNGINYFTNENASLVIASPMKPEWYVNYVRPWSLVGVFIAKKIYKIELVQFINLVLFNWRALNSKRQYFSGYPILTPDWFTLRFLGTYYFKILNF